MPELVATGPGTGDRAQRDFPEGTTLRIGRAPLRGWALPWDPTVSREHADLTLKQGILTVRCIDSAHNPVFHKGKSYRELQIRVGDEFRIGRTAIALRPEGAASFSSELLEEQALGQDELERFKFGHSERRLELLSKLPQLLATANTDEDVAHIVVRLLLDAVPALHAAAILRYGDVYNDQGIPQMMHSEVRNSAKSFRPSRRLLKAGLNSGKGMLHIWDTAQSARNADFTALGNLDWAYCTPLRDPTCQGWCMYVSGKFEPAKPREQLNGDLRFVEFLGEFLGAMRRIRSLEHKQASFSQFFSPAVLQTLSDNQAESLLQPKLGPISVLFCDVRGFSRKAEAADSTDMDLMGLFNRVGTALGVMTRGIAAEAGVIADFQGDAALGFWGWPSALEEGPVPACRAALSILAEFHRASSPEGALAGFQVGIGLAHGMAVAGRMGTDEQAKVGAFGSVVNLASRLEGMTKLLGTSILMDQTTAEFVQKSVPRSVARARKLGKFRPYGMEKSIKVYELLPPDQTPGSVTDAVLALTDAGLAALHAGDWAEARRLFQRTVETDPPSQFFLAFMADHANQPPADWTGTIALRTK